MKTDLQRVLDLFDAAGFVHHKRPPGRLNATDQQKTIIRKNAKIGRATFVRGDYTATAGSRTVHFWKGRETGIIRSEDFRKFETKDFDGIREYLETLC